MKASYLGHQVLDDLVLFSLLVGTVTPQLFNGRLQLSLFFLQRLDLVQQLTFTVVADVLGRINFKLQPQYQMSDISDMHARYQG